MRVLVCNVVEMEWGGGDGNNVWVCMGWEVGGCMFIVEGVG